MRDVGKKRVQRSAPLRAVTSGVPLTLVSCSLTRAQAVARFSRGLRRKQCALRIVTSLGVSPYPTRGLAIVSDEFMGCDDGINAGILLLLPAAAGYRAY